MPITTGRTYLAIPGPSVSPERVLNAMHRSAPNIYEGEIVDMVRTMIPDLRRVAATSQHVAIYIANGHGAWEAANCNMFSRGDRALLARISPGVVWIAAFLAMLLGLDRLLPDVDVEGAALERRHPHQVHDDSAQVEDVPATR